MSRSIAEKLLALSFYRCQLPGSAVCNTDFAASFPVIAVFLRIQCFGVCCLQLPIVGCWFLMSGVIVGGSGLFLVVRVSVVECCMLTIGCQWLLCSRLLHGHGCRVLIAELVSS